MKKLSIAILTLVSALFMFSSCSSDDSKNIALLGYWQCTNISGTLLGSTTDLTSSSYCKVFSVAFIGASNGVYLRTDPTKLATNGLTTSDSTANATALSNFLSKGTYSCSGDNITLTDANGKGAVTYGYSVSNNTLTLTQTVASSSSTASAVVSSALSLISAFTGSSLAQTGSVTYTYTKLSTASVANLFNSSEAN